MSSDRVTSRSRITTVIVAAAIVSTVAGCVSKGDYDAKDAEVKALKAELQTIKSELEDVKFGADRLLGQAQAEMKKKNYQAAMSTAQTLLDKHPSANEAKQAPSIIASAKQAIKLKQDEAKRIAEAKKREAERKRAEAKRLADAKVRQEKERLARALRNMRTKYDEVEGMTWYYDKNSPKFINSRSDISLYMGKKAGSEPWLRFIVSYAADDWLFIERFVIKADGQSFTLEPPQYGEGALERDNGYGGIWEWLDVNAEGQHIEIAKAVANSRKAIIRYDGKQYYKDRVVTATEKQAIRNILAAKQALEAQ